MGSSKPNSSNVGVGASITNDFYDPQKDIYETNNETDISVQSYKKTHIMQ